MERDLEFKKCGICMKRMEYVNCVFGKTTRSDQNTPGLEADN